MGTWLHTVEGKALAVVVPLVLGQKVLEIEIGIVHVANFVFLVDEVAIRTGCVSVVIQLRMTCWIVTNSSFLRSGANLGSAGRPDQRRRNIFTVWGLLGVLVGCVGVDEVSWL